MASVHPVDAPGPISYQPPNLETNPLDVVGNNENWVKPEGAGGLTLLDGVDKVYVEQQLDLLEVMTHIDRPNTYKIVDSDDKQLFFLEEKDTGSRVINREFNVKAKDAYGKEVFNITRDFKQCSYCFFCCACVGPCKSEAKVKENGTTIGKMIQNWSVRDVKFKIMDDDDKDILRIVGRIECCSLKADYEVQTDGGKKIGSIKKGGEGFSKGENRYTVKFPENSSSKEKALILGMTILLDYRFHYYVPPVQHRRRR